MPELTVVLTMGDDTLEMRGFTLKEMLAVKSWSAGDIKTPVDIQAGVAMQDPAALQAAIGLAVWRRTGTKPRLDDLDFDYDNLDAVLHDSTGRAVEPVFELNDDGSLRQGENGPIPVLESDGSQRFKYVDTGETVPPTSTPSPTKSATSPKRGSSSGSPVGTTTLAAV